MYSGLLHAHSGLRWIVLALLVYAVINAFTRKNTYEAKDKKLYKFTMIFTHVQMTLGLILYFVSPRIKFPEGWMGDSVQRFLHMEHFVGMILAVVLITLAKGKAEKADNPVTAQKKARMFFTIALVLILAMIPWPVREALGGSWF